MIKRSLLPFLLMVLTGMGSLWIMGGCANILPPSGGPRDSLPPILIRATPADSTLRFSGNQIRFVFDEFVEVEDYMKNLIMSPVPQTIPTVTRKLETITVRLRDDLEPNTTYVFNFGNSIVDLNEGNIFRDFTYVVSTGNYFDSLTYTGMVIMAQSGEVDTTLMVMLHSNPEDSAVREKKPRYVSRVDREGRFRFNYLAPGTYYLYALKDESGAYRYLNPEQQIFAFADSPVQISADSSEAIQLLAYQVPAIKETTSTGQNERRGRAEKRLRYSVNLKGSQQDLLIPFILNFETPIRDFDSTRIRFSSDTTYIPIETGYSWSADSTRQNWSLNYPWKENTLYHLILDQDFATDTLGQQLLKSDTVSFFSKKISDYGKLTLRFRNLDMSDNPVLQFVQNKEVVYSFPLTEPNFSRPLFMPGEYSLRILRDVNGNGIWDPGNFFGTKRQPEVAKPIKRTINIKPNQDIPIEIDVNEL